MAVRRCVGRVGGDAVTAGVTGGVDKLIAAWNDAVGRSQIIGAGNDLARALVDAEAREKQLRRWCDEGGGSRRGFIAIADILYLLAAGGENPADSKERT